MELHVIREKIDCLSVVSEYIEHCRSRTQNQYVNESDTADLADVLTFSRIICKMHSLHLFAQVFAEIFVMLRDSFYPVCDFKIRLGFFLGAITRHALVCMSFRQVAEERQR